MLKNNCESIRKAEEKEINTELIDSFPNHPYHVFDDEDMTELTVSIKEKELQDFMKNEPSFRYFDSLCLNIYAVLHSYSEYSAIKSKYGDEFLELLMDVQELLTEIEGGT